MVENYADFTKKAHDADCKVAVAADILSLALLTPPGEWGADIVFGTTQRLGTPMFYGGPSVGYFATRDEYKPGICRDESSDGPKINMANSATEWPCRHANSTSNGKKRLPIFVRLRHYSQQWPASTPYITDRKESKRLLRASTASPFFLDKQLKKFGYTQVNTQYFDHTFRTAGTRFSPTDSHDCIEQGSKPALL